MTPFLRQVPSTLSTAMTKPEYVDRFRFSKVPRRAKLGPLAKTKAEEKSTLSRFTFASSMLRVA
jgi:hypothetical protein